MNTQHTPGPWEVWGNLGEIDIAVGPVAGGVAVCQVATANGIGLSTPNTKETGAANAVLIAQAPALLEALENIAPKDGPEPVDTDNGPVCPHCYGEWSNSDGDFRHTFPCPYVKARQVIEAARKVDE